MNEELEDKATKVCGMDLYCVVEVDTHIHANKSMNSSSLLGFIKDKLRNEGNTVVFPNYKGRENVILQQLMDILGLGNPDGLPLDKLATEGGFDTCRCFDVWLKKSDPFGNDVLHNVFLNTMN